MAYPLRLIGGVGILLAIGASRHDLPTWIGAIGGLLCIAFVVVTVSTLLGR